MNENITRREAIRRTFIFSTALLVPGWFTRLGAAQAETLPDGGIHLLLFADFGMGDKNQAAVARGMEEFAARLKQPLTGVLALGDNFYGSWRADRFDTQFEKMYRVEFLNCPFHVCLGNHDYEGPAWGKKKWQYELEYAKENPHSRWKMPSKWYSVEMPSPKFPLVRVIMLDSNFCQNLLTAKEKEEQAQFLAQELQKPTHAPWTFVVGHHPIFSNGAHGDTPALIEKWGPALNAAKVPFYFCGHDHTMQHLEIEGYESSFVVSGGGGAPLHPMGDTHKDGYCRSLFGFTHLHVTDDHVLVQLLDEAGNRLHAFTRDREGRVQVQV